jgi:protein involved in polysaccharide export with SLBB domain
MIWNRWISTLALLVLAACWAGCETDRPHAYVCSDDVIRVGDALRISLLDIGPDALQEKEFVVRTDGSVNLPLIGSLIASNKTFSAFEREIQSAYIDKKFYRQITVVAKPGDRFYYVSGEVKGATRQIYTGPTTVLRAIAACGDFTDFANRKRVEILRANGDREVMDCKRARKNPKVDRPVCPGDHIIVPRSL